MEHCYDVSSTEIIIELINNVANQEEMNMVCINCNKAKQGIRR